MKNYSSIFSAFALQRVEEQILYYDRRLTSTVVPPDLKPYLSGTHSLYLKQVPSVQTLRRAGNSTPESAKPFLMKEGFLHPSMDNAGYPENPSPVLSWDSEELRAIQEDSPEDVPTAIPASSRNCYEDPFKILAAWSFYSQYGGERPKISVWAGGCHRIQDKLHPSLFGISGSNLIYFTDIQGHDEKMYFLFNHTHWGSFIQSHRKKPKGESPLRYFANTLFRRISHLIRGLHDPIWTEEEKTRYCNYATPRSKPYRAQRLLEVLKTVDGLFLQRYLSYPEEAWDWEKFDLFSIQAISILITDEFFDGEVTDITLGEHRTFYEMLKAARKTFKLVIHEDEPEKHISRMDNQPRWIQSYLGGTWKKALRHEGFARLYLAGTLSQTRGSGTPPPLVILRSKRKFIKSVGEMPPQVSQTERNLILTALNAELAELPDHVFSGLATKVRITVTGSACWEATRKDGGTAQAVLQIMSKYSDLQIPERDLETGKVLLYKDKGDFESVGTAIFYACLNEVLETDPEELREVHMTLVKEPGKARVVTKGRAALKIVLDTISKIVSVPLKKGFESSASGMGRSHHGWNFFKDYSSEEMHDLLFSEQKQRREQDDFADHIDRVQYWQDVWFCSTDYQEATDRMVHTIGGIIAQSWMRKCGIPKLLQGIVMGICFQPRKVFFSALGPLRDLGDKHPNDINSITLRRGVLMGDPLTKVILHFCNIITRRIGQTLADGSIFKGFVNSHEALEAYLNGIKVGTDEGRKHITGTAK